MNAISTNKDNPYFAAAIESLCVVCNKELNHLGKSVYEIIPNVDPPTTALEALKCISNFQHLNIEPNQLKLCEQCFLNTSLARHFQLQCNKSVENITVYLNCRGDIKCLNISNLDITERQNNQNKGESEPDFNFINSKVKSEEICVTFEATEGNKSEASCEDVEEDRGQDNADSSEEDSVGEGKPKNIRQSVERLKTDETGMRKECPVCLKMFRKENIRRHIRTHTGEMPHKCDLCGKAFNVKETLKNHLLYHNKERNFLCTFCGKGFYIKSALDNHIRMHTDERPYPCDTCGKAFRTSTARRIHYSVHSGEKRYACEQCPKRFPTARSLRQHRVVHAEIKPWECTFCGKRFPHKHVLKSHQAKTCQRINAI